ncbi:hypothetical protein HYV44_00210 [Candidatus Microgenomates bacterium]|nr:hypothetical protein [Candidatus Microgenomates bacterium]
MRDELIKKLQELDIIYQNPVNLKNAGMADFYVDIKKAYGDPGALNMMADEVWKRIDQSITSIVAGGYGGLPLATTLSFKHKIHLTLVRDKPKEHGKNNWIDGYIPNEKDKVAIVDDVFTTGGSLKKMIEIVEPTGAEIVGCYVVVKRGDGDISCPLTHILTSEELV